MKSLSTGGNRAHGDWLNDTIELTTSGVKHKIHFSSGAKWQIVCKDYRSYLPSSLIFHDFPTKIAQSAYDRVKSNARLAL
jgi:hypothetical protein